MPKRLWTENLPESLFTHVLNTLVSENFVKDVELSFEKKGEATHNRHQFYTWRLRIREQPAAYDDVIVANIDRILVKVPFMRDGRFILTFCDNTASEKKLLAQLADRVTTRPSEPIQ